MKIPDIDPAIRIDSLEDANKYLQRKLLQEQERLAATDRRVAYLEDKLLFTEDELDEAKRTINFYQNYYDYKIIKFLMKTEKTIHKFYKKVKNYALRYSSKSRR